MFQKSRFITVNIVIIQNTLILLCIGYTLIVSIYNNISQDSNIISNNIIMILSCIIFLSVRRDIHNKYSSSHKSQKYNNYSIEWFLKATNISLTMFIVALYLYLGNNTNADGNSNKFAYISGICSIFLGFITQYILSNKASVQDSADYLIAREHFLTLLNINVNLVLLIFWLANQIDFSGVCYGFTICTIFFNLVILSPILDTHSILKSKIINYFYRINSILLCSIIILLMYWFIENQIFLITSICIFIIFIYPARKFVLRKYQRYIYIVTMRSFFWTSHALLIAIIILLSFRRDFAFDYNHYSYILMPAYTLAAGGTPLVNLNSQYGVGILYFINVLYLFSAQLFSFSSFSFINNILNIIFYVTLLYLTWKFTNKTLWISYLLIITIVFNRLCQLGGTPELFPSTGFLRFGMPWLYILYESKRLKTTTINILSWWIIGIASAWSAEVFLWIAALFICSKLYDIIDKKMTLQDIFIYLTKCFLFFISASITSWALLCANIFVQSGSLPDLRRYTDFLGLYGAGFGFAYPDGRGLWSMMFILYSNTAIYCILKKFQNSSQNSINIQRVFLISILGILQLTYYVFRSHSNNLYHIMWPTVLIIAFWVGIIVDRSRYVADYWAVIALSTVAATIGVLIMNIVFNVSNINNTLFEFMITNNVKVGRESFFTNNGDRVSSEAVRAREIIGHYAKNNKIPLLVNEGLATEILLGSGWINKFEITFEEQDSLIESGVNGIIKMAQEIPFKSYIYIGKDIKKLSALKYKIVEILCNRARLIVVDVNDVIDVVYFEERGVRSEGDWCDRNLSGYILQRG